ncbi:MAG: hypothetical protein Q8R08_01120 [bacterium]|nr:hypothetical protein [bacterium]
MTELRLIPEEYSQQEPTRHTRPGVSFDLPETEVALGENEITVDAGKGVIYFPRQPATDFGVDTNRQMTFDPEKDSVTFENQQNSIRLTIARSNGAIEEFNIFGGYYMQADSTEK